MRARYNREYYHRDWNDPVNYHMVLNTEALGFDGAAEMIVARARGMGGRETEKAETVKGRNGAAEAAFVIPRLRSG